MKREIFAAVGLAAAAGVVTLGLLWHEHRVHAAAMPNEMHRGAAAPETGETLHAVGYSAWSEPGASHELSGVTRYDPARSAGGYNLYTDYTHAAYLMDMHGRIVHTWNFQNGEGESREFARMLPDGSLLSHGPSLIRLAWDSTELWRTGPLAGDAFSHDLEMLDDGSMLVPSVKEAQYNGYKVSNEFVEHIDPDRRLIAAWSGLKHIPEMHRYYPPTVFDMKGVTPDTTDYFHANTVRVLPDTPLGRKDARFRKGNWLICLRQLSLVAVIDQKTQHVVWGWGPGTLDHPHSPVMLPDGQILVFDNGLERGWSRLVKVDPSRDEVTWTYEGHPRGEFYTAERGFIQPLPNGNLLVTLSGNGQAVEMTMDGAIVWEFYHPQLEGNQRRAIYRMIRYPEAMVAPLLGAPAETTIASTR
jgi:hypothetical protein